MAGRADGAPHITSEGITFESADVELLEAIDAVGSLNAAADELGRSFAHSQRRIVELEEAFGPLVERRRGGSGGGGSELTDEARELIARFERLEAEFTGVAEATQTVLAGCVVDRDGELATVETGAGPIRALVPPGADRVEVWIRADAVTITTPSDTPEPEGTSARNRFAGVVSSVDRGTAVARVSVDIGAKSPVVALVTIESVTKLGLEPGRDVVTTWKATATRARSRTDADAT